MARALFGRERAFCRLCGALTTNTDTRLCRAHSDLDVDFVPPEPLESIPMQAAALADELLGEAMQATRERGA